MRKFKQVESKYLVFPDVETELPERADSGSAGYDFRSKEDYVLAKGESHIFWTDVKAKMSYDNVLLIDVRSGLGVKKGIALKNTIGVIDGSYYGNPTNDGNIGICLVNNGAEDVTILTGDRIAQGIFIPYYITADDRWARSREESKSGGTRLGGFGSSGK